MLESPRRTTDLEILADGTIYAADGRWLRVVPDWTVSKEWEYPLDCGEDVNHIQLFGSRLYCSDAGLGITVFDSTGVLDRLLPGIRVTSNIVVGDTMYAGGSRGQLFRSSDTGRTWTVANPERLLKSDDTIDMIIQTNDHICYRQAFPRWDESEPVNVFSLIDGRWHAATIPRVQGFQSSNDLFYSFLGRSILVSRDCIEWSELVTVPSDRDIELFTIIGDFILVGTLAHKYFHSADGGITWQNVDGRFSNVWPRFLTLGHDGYLYAISDNNRSIYRTFKPFIQMFD